MNYLKNYCCLIRKAENRTIPEGYIEKHHIFPKSIFGKNKRVVALTAREHYIAHLLLWKGFNKRYGSSDRRAIKMFYALWCMINGNGKNPRSTNSKIYSEMRTLIQKNQNVDEEWRKKVKNGVIKSYENEDYRKRKAEINKNLPNNPKWVESMERVISLSEKRYIIYFDDGRMCEIKGMAKWCRNNGYNPSSVKNLLLEKNKGKSHKNIIKVEKLN